VIGAEDADTQEGEVLIGMQQIKEGLNAPVRVQIPTWTAVPRGCFDELGSLSFRPSAGIPHGLLGIIGWAGRCATAVGRPNQTVVIAQDLATTERPRRAELPFRNCGLGRIG
jgi:hypothetical protein